MRHRPEFSVVEPVARDILEALRRLEYRGYDSAGIATLEDGKLTRVRASGAAQSQEKLAVEPLEGPYRRRPHALGDAWPADRENAHPHAAEKVAVVQTASSRISASCARSSSPRAMFSRARRTPKPVAHLVAEELKKRRPRRATRSGASLKRLQGRLRAGVSLRGASEDLLIGARRGSPLAVGFGPERRLSRFRRAGARASSSTEITYLDEDDWVEAVRARAPILNAVDAIVERARSRPLQAGLAARRQGQLPPLHGEGIHEQPEVVGRALAHYSISRMGPCACPSSCPSTRRRFARDDFRLRHGLLRRRSSRATGSSASRGSPVESTSPRSSATARRRCAEGGLMIVVSQSGETADTLAALRYAKARGPAYALDRQRRHLHHRARERDAAPTSPVPRSASPPPRPSPASSPSSPVSRWRSGARAASLSEAEEKALVASSRDAGADGQALKNEARIEPGARLARASSALYLGRGPAYPLALEGALKLKELSYIHAEGYAAGDEARADRADRLCHAGHRARPAGREPGEDVSNLQEVAARGGPSDPDRPGERPQGRRGGACGLLEMPEEAAGAFAALVYAIPAQLLAYHVAVFMGKDVDQPRNLAKSVTVE